MAAAKKKAAAGPKNFPKEQGEDGAPDRFIPPDRADQIPNEDDDRPTVIQVKDLSEGLEVIEDEEREEREERREGAADDDDAPDSFEDDEEGEEDDTRGRNGRGRGRYSKRVRARINRERTLTSQERLRADNAERRAKQMEERVAKLERVSTEVEGSQQVKELEAKIASMKEELKQAIEKGDTTVQLDLTIKMGELQGDLRVAKRDLEDAKRKQLADEEERKKTREQEDAAAAAGGNDAGEGGGDAQEWIGANKTWWGKPRYARQQQMAVNLDKEILAEIAEGELDVEKYSDEHFEILNERLAKLYPDLPLHNADGEPYEEGAEDEANMNNRDRNDRRDTRSSGRRPPVGGQGTGRNGRRQVSEADLARQGKVRLSEGDFTQMRMYGLDPKNAEHKKRFAKERMRTILTDERRAERGTGARR